MNLLDDPNNLGMLSLGLRLMSTPGKFGPALGQAGLGAIGDVQQAKAAQQAQQAKALQQRMLEMQMQQIQQEQARRRGVEGAYRGAFESPATQAMAGGGGPTVANAEAMNGMQPRVNQQKLIEGLMRAGAVEDAYKLMQPKAADMVALNPGQVLFDKTRGAEVTRIPEKADPGTTDMRNFQAGTQDPAFMRFLNEQADKKGVKVSVPVHLGQKGLDNTLKLRGDFRSEPVYKAHQEMQSSYAQIKQALGQASPAGDLAGATKIMKLLDPGSVVRESELGMAMAASGLLDRIENYAQNILNGTKLTPTQRKDFQALADALYGESVKSYNAKRQEYQGIAERNQLSVADVLGPESSAPPSGDVDDLVNKYRSK